MPSRKVKRTELSSGFNGSAGLARHFPALGILTKGVASNILHNPGSGDRRLDLPMQGALIASNSRNPLPFSSSA